MAKIRIVLVDDHEMVLQGVRLALQAEPDMVVVGEARSGEEAIRLAREAQPDVMLLDVRLGDLEGPQVCRRALEVAPRCAVVMLTSYMQDALVFRSLVAGAKGYVIKDVELSELKRMIRSVFRGHAVLDPKITPQVISTAARRGSGELPEDSPGKAVLLLSETDFTIMRCLSEGLTNKEIAGRVHLSPHTIKDHIEKICAALGVGTRTEIVAEALRRGLI